MGNVDNIKDLLLHAKYFNMLGHSIEEQAGLLNKEGFVVAVVDDGAVSQCKDCIHCEVCEDFANSLNEATKIAFNQSVGIKFPYENIKCKTFKPKSRFIELPCAVGDIVYRTLGNYCGEKIFEGVVDQISIFNNGEIRFWVYGHPLGFACDDIGKTVFLTKEEAEKTLKEKQQ